ncbi:DinB family protein [Paenibacillus sp. IITD108]|uniref:DinB family protein n=1 Tax=Paenibacillus sp. IITD108 TaxID=3116649 RepID=UPI002F3EB50B
MELQEIHRNLKETREDLLKTLNGLSEEQLHKQKDSNSWTINQIYQHLIKTEELYVAAIKRGLKSNEDSVVGDKALDFLLDRSKKIEAPEIARPSSGFIDRQEIIEKLNHSRAKLNEILNTLEDPTVLSRRHFVHPVFKEMLLMEWVKSIYLHEQRHIKQIIEIIDGK